jgi:hypothetical protein
MPKEFLGRGRGNQVVEGYRGQIGFLNNPAVNIRLCPAALTAIRKAGPQPSQPSHKPIAPQRQPLRGYRVSVVLSKWVWKVRRLVPTLVSCGHRPDSSARRPPKGVYSAWLTAKLTSTLAANEPKRPDPTRRF